MTDGSQPAQIVLTGLRVRGHHGVLAHERRDGQDFVVDVALDVDVAAAAATDALAATVDYSAVAHAVAAVVSGEPFDLIERLAAEIADACLIFSPVTAVDVTVHKPQAPIDVPFDDVAVHLRRTRS
jgi:dihydroneopterin aldolase